jgi:hypothetical protein
MLLFLTELPFRERIGRSDDMDCDGSTGDMLGEDSGGTGGYRALMCPRPFVTYTNRKSKVSVEEKMYIIQ